MTTDVRRRKGNALHWLPGDIGEQSDPICTPRLIIAEKSSAPQIGGSVRVAPDDGLLRSAAGSVPYSPLVGLAG